uniref:hypothetical protein n=1 Tax=Klebsiella pneumoniae TaxID=573 RepID=UPI001953C130
IATCHGKFGSIEVVRNDQDLGYRRGTDRHCNPATGRRLRKLRYKFWHITCGNDQRLNSRA